MEEDGPANGSEKDADEDADASDKDADGSERIGQGRR